MVSQIKPGSGALVVTFNRDNEKPEILHARDGEHAWRHAISLIARRQVLLSGDTLTVRRIENVQAAQRGAFDPLPQLND